MMDGDGAAILPDLHTLPSPPDLAATDWGRIDGQEELYYDAETDSYWARIRNDPEYVPLKVVSVVASVSKTLPRQLPPIYNDIGPDAFDELADLTITDASLGELSVSVTYAGYEVTVHGDGVIRLCQPSDESLNDR